MSKGVFRNQVKIIFEDPPIDQFILSELPYAIQLMFLNLNAIVLASLLMSAKNCVV